MSEDTPIVRIGLIGLGRASTSMIWSIQNHPHFRITAASDLRDEALRQFSKEFQAETYPNMEDLCRSPQVDAVYIATPHQFHLEHTVTAAKHGKHIIVEKPMALTIEDCQRMIDAVERYGVKLLVGHTHSFDPPIMKIREMVESKAYGKLGMINMWNYTDFLYRPRRPEELDTRLGGGILFNQVPHQIDMVRWIGGGLVRSVRSMTGIWDASRPTEGSQATFLEFESGACATMVYSAYDHFDSDELHYGISEGGTRKRADRHGSARKALFSLKSPLEEQAWKEDTGYGGKLQKTVPAREDMEKFHPHFGITIVSCEKADLRPSPAGVYVYGDEGKSEVEVPLGRAVPDKGKVLDEFYQAIVHNQPLKRDGKWGMATLEVCLAILESSRQRKEIYLDHQTAVTDE